MTTLQLPDQDLTGYEPGSAAGGGRCGRAGCGAAGGTRPRAWLLLAAAGLGPGPDRPAGDPSGPDDVRHQARGRHRPGRVLPAAVAPVEPAGVAGQPAGPVHRLRLPDGPVLPGRRTRCTSRCGSPNGCGCRSSSRWGSGAWSGWPRPSASGPGRPGCWPARPSPSGPRTRSWSAPPRPRCCPGSSPPGPRFRWSATGPPRPGRARPARTAPGSGHRGVVRRRPLGPVRGLHGRGQRGLDAGRPGAAGDVHPDQAVRPPVGPAGLGGAGRAAGHRLVAGPAVLPGQIRLQLPAVHRAVGHHHLDHVG